jgi:type II secretion system protein J
MNTALTVHSRQAFTLLEILIALAIFAIVLAAINTVFYSAIKLRNHTIAVLDQAAPIDHALAIIRRDLANIVPPSRTNYALQTTVMTDTQFGQSTPEFYTATGQIDGLTQWGDVQKVGYGLVPAADGSRELIRLVSHNLFATTTETPEQQSLLSGVQSIAFHYFDGTQWAEVWDSTTQSNLPTAIKVDLSLTNTLMHMVVALDNQVRTNQ